MNRRDACLAVCALGAVPLAGRAQTAGKTYRIGALAYAASKPAFVPLLSALRESGFEEGRNLIVDYRFAEGQQERLPGLAAELLANKVDLIVAVTNPEVVAAKRVTATVPIVMMFSSSPVEYGLVASLARPGGNVTGTTIQGPETAGKILEVLRDAAPRLKRVALLVEPEFPGMEFYIRVTERAAEAMGLQLTQLPVRSLADLETAFTSVVRMKSDALFVAQTGVIFRNRARVIEFAARNRLPAVYTGKNSVNEGGLLYYGFDVKLLIPRTAGIIVRILNGAKPADLPVEQPAGYELVVNMKTAVALGLTIPQSLLLRADEVIR